MKYTSVAGLLRTIAPEKLVCNATVRPFVRKYALHVNNGEVFFCNNLVPKASSLGIGNGGLTAYIFNHDCASILCSIDTCQKKASADLYHVTIELIKVTCLLGLTAAQLEVFYWSAESNHVSLLQSGAKLLGLAK